jgi:hypothetical protein
MKLTPYNFSEIAGVKPCNWEQPLYFVGTGMSGAYDLGWMSTAAGRRDFGSGISGSQLADERSTCFKELRLAEPYPDNSYCVELTGALRLLDIRGAESSSLSGKYYSEDRSESCQIMEANREYLKTEGYDGIVRYSQPLLKEQTYVSVVAITPDAIGKLGVRQVEPIGSSTQSLVIRLPDGKEMPAPFKTP